ncbi:unnamed protein product [Spirodela intermedia]|uniref:AB hydrolase-1 domain-containing protein n=1 Tax=Spirodela intermedia TaxID=51605 RepID=A0A7I8IES2_SPIIN|nr:unnamed protein product [Spirodela intermedia]CAA6655894.1 unnamed protein product [Spirodela intermedia]
MGTGGDAATRSALCLAGRVVNDVLSFFVFSILDLVDVILCIVFKLIDYAVEAEWNPCYCSSATDKVVCLFSRKLQLEDISDTLYSRPSLVSEVSKCTVRELRRLKMERAAGMVAVARRRAAAVRSAAAANGSTTTTFTINSTIVEMLQGKIGGQQSLPVPRWSDCDCGTCTSWTSSAKDSLFVRAEGPKGERGRALHPRFISSSLFWTETVFPNFSEEAKSRYRLIAVDLLGFGRSPKPTDSLYTLREHVDMIERSVLEPYKVKQFHIVAHSLGCILALALAVKYPGAVKSLTLLAPPYFPVPKGEQGTQLWPPISFGASVACWYEHISRMACVVLCKNHRLWEFAVKQITRNRVRTFLMDGFFCHTHNAAWHTLHNIICGSAGKMDGYLDAVRSQLSCDVTVFHGRDDELLPVECSLAVQSKIPRAQVKVIEKKDHLTIVVGRQKAFAGELEEIWGNTKG